MLSQFEDTNETNDTKEGEGCTGFGAGTTHGGHDLEEGHIVGHDGRHVHYVLKVLPETELTGANYKPDDDLQGEPTSTSGLNDEEGVQKIGRLIFHAMAHGEHRQRFNTK